MRDGLKGPHSANAHLLAGGLRARAVIKISQNFWTNSLYPINSVAMFDEDLRTCVLLTIPTLTFYVINIAYLRTRIEYCTVRGMVELIVFGRVFLSVPPCTIASCSAALSKQWSLRSFSEKGIQQKYKTF